ncbi:MAG: hypothetical protein MZV64_21015 [Ignavibacteriales bacterium]|nr:hypothetical protein [Ignavibacteriales bacterium]
MELPDLPRVIIMLIIKPVKWSLQQMHTLIHSLTPASFNQLVMILVNEGGIMDLWVREARLFKYGSGTGSNFSDLRGT